MDTTTPEEFSVTTTRLRLRLHRPDDAPWLHSIYSREDVTRYLMTDAWNPERAVNEAAQRAQARDLRGPQAALAVVIELDAQPIGDVRLWMTDPQHGVAEIATVLHPDFRGHGYASEAMRAMIRYACTRCGVHRVAAQMDARDRVCELMLQHAGMSKEAHMRQDFWLKGEWTDTIVYAVLASDLDENAGAAVGHGGEAQAPIGAAADGAHTRASDVRTELSGSTTYPVER
ncbi:GNAT family N-acetyltransferase [Actinotignum sanguinis]|uniref:GNAT family N-acetyltransferase n=1 Tax=Actinotignum sanguinis TaxID=1445614 RepID=UPI00237DED5D|nr:GNAT family N-acetyltransferase [Actinotignum sanguinis]MDE1553477.1 GNAT family N-acetyltransferase [Actinotignum sanguinis]MDE1566497.1 GNAT family N-acetyltransferase [Actinotignum sanguinis]MDE1577780.1 GNAT family N-acetyltransferase [Actinotignum sanguinis]MDE1643169.1 GNAT family N-acetyltransferase [Actinotignum sanguinis]MDK8657561.1 GNAT family N-acetyltransferase [Actinotignum sanguinis]